MYAYINISLNSENKSSTEFVEFKKSDEEKVVTKSIDNYACKNLLRKYFKR